MTFELYFGLRVISPSKRSKFGLLREGNDIENEEKNGNTRSHQTQNQPNLRSHFSDSNHFVW